METTLSHLRTRSDITGSCWPLLFRAFSIAFETENPPRRRSPQTGHAKFGTRVVVYCSRDELCNSIGFIVIFYLNLWEAGAMIHAEPCAALVRVKYWSLN